MLAGPPHPMPSAGRPVVGRAVRAPPGVPALRGGRGSGLGVLRASEQLVRIGSRYVEALFNYNLVLDLRDRPSGPRLGPHGRVLHERRLFDLSPVGARPAALEADSGEKGPARRLSRCRALRFRKPASPWRAGVAYWRFLGEITVVLLGEVGGAFESTGQAQETGPRPLRRPFGGG